MHPMSLEPTTLPSIALLREEGESFELEVILCSVLIKNLPTDQMTKHWMMQFAFS